jgi:hypothetical protein
VQLGQRCLDRVGMGDGVLECKMQLGAGFQQFGCYDFEFAWR